MHSRTLHLSDRSVSNFGAVSPPGRPMPTQPDSFATGIHRETVEPSAPPPAPSTESLLLLVKTRLMSTKPMSVELQIQRAVLLAEPTIDLAAADEFLEACRAEQTLSLEQKQEAARAACRKQFKVVGSLHQALKDAELNLMRVAAKQQGALEALKALALLEEKGKHIPRWATWEEKAEWAERLDAAKERVAQANANAATALNERNKALLAIEPAEALMNKLAADELRLRKAISGEAFVDPELGLSSTPSGRA